MPSSRPKPDCLKPPNGVETRTELFELMLSTPASSARATRSARAPFCVQIEPERPYGVSFAIRIASASSSNGISAATGPKTSSRAIAVVVRRLDERAREPEAGAVRRLALERDAGVVVDEARDGRAVLGGDQRAHLGRLVARVADLHVRGRLGEEAREAVVGAALDEDARAGAAVLAGVVEDGVGRGGGGALEVGVGEDHVGGLAAELERDALDRVGGAAHDSDADLGRAGEADLGDVGVLDEPLADDGAFADEDVHDAFGDAGFEDRARRAGAARAGSARRA